MKPDNQPQSEISDQQLDALLQDIELPADLEDTLFCISDSENVLVQTGSLTSSSSPSNSRSSTAAWVSLAIAASLLAAMAFSGWHWMTPGKQPGFAGKLAGKVGEAGTVSAASTPIMNTSEADQLLEEILNIEKQVEIVLAEREYAEAEQRVWMAEMKDTQHLSQFETQSMIFAIGDQALISQGGSAELVAFDMTNVIGNFPGSRGAELAEQFLKSQN